MDYKEGELIFAYSGPLLYPAKILKCQHSGTKTQYLIHYMKWNPKYDEWVEATRIMKHAKSTIELAERLQQDVSNKSKKATGAGVGTGEGAGTKRRRLDATMETEQVEEGTALRFAFPYAIKRHLVEDWENVVQKKLLTRLPATQSVVNIFADFVADESSHEATGEADIGTKTDKKSPTGAARSAESTSSSKIARKEVCDALQQYFDRSLPVMLLFKFERLQYDAVASQAAGHSAPSQIYGAPHLLRLLVRLPSVAEHASFSAAECDAFAVVIGSLIKFLTSNSTTYFSSEQYGKASADYCKAFEGASQQRPGGAVAKKQSASAAAGSSLQIFETV